MMGYWLPLSALVALILVFSSHPIIGVASEETGATFSLFGSPILIVKAMLFPKSLMGILGSSHQQHQRNISSQHHPTRKPTMMTGMKVVFDSFYEEDYGVAHVQIVEEEVPLQGKNRLSHERKKEG
ncbi:hypothetical protein IV203_007148 [Nitzschia inconspicua]|uniref:Uncharacterized protein n=1 Tax=Nitzschia inconspicua TaxID=303405 RepID=A0A9K3PCX4_9STRA|nr:hypothetical protein IV203_007148 [Nitzschia inconspicua]